MIALIEHDCILPSITAALSPCIPYPQSRVKSLFDASSLLDPRLRPAHCFQFTVPAPDSVFEVNEQLFFEDPTSVRGISGRTIVKKGPSPSKSSSKEKV